MPNEQACDPSTRQEHDMGTKACAAQHRQACYQAGSPASCRIMTSKSGTAKRRPVERGTRRRAHSGRRRRRPGSACATAQFAAGCSPTPAHTAHVNSKQQHGCVIGRQLYPPCDSCSTRLFPWPHDISIPQEDEECGVAHHYAFQNPGLQRCASLLARL